LYFYVDAPQTRNGELMDRVYVSTNSSYTYTIYPQSSLILNEEMHNAPQLKWEWVYDVLGYYVLGTEDVSGNVNVTEYIRPITYEYDETNVLFDGTPSRWVSSIGGVPVTEFLHRVSSKDGYPGAITPQTVPTPTGYYPISVDANGYGVWAYLCNWYDIENNMRYDTQLSGSSLKILLPILPIVNILTVAVSNVVRQLFLMENYGLSGYLINVLPSVLLSAVMSAGNILLGLALAIPVYEKKSHTYDPLMEYNFN
jgi:hypothetical protein